MASIKGSQRRRLLCEEPAPETPVIPKHECYHPASDEVSSLTPRSIKSLSSTSIPTPFPGANDQLPGLEAFSNGLGRKIQRKEHPLVTARNAFDAYFKNNYATLVEPRKEYLASLRIEKGKTEGLDFLQNKMEVKLSKMIEALQHNANIAKAISLQTQELIESSKIPGQVDVATNPMSAGLGPNDGIAEVSSADEAICRSTIRQLWRDWSIEAEMERNVCFKPILSAISSLVSNSSGSNISVLVPGAGLARLAYEIAKIGKCSVTANELSYPHILALHWILNCDENQPKTVYPWATQFSNHASSDDQFQSYELVSGNSDKSQLDVIQDCNRSSKVRLVHRNLTVTPDDFRSYGATQRAETVSCVVTAFFLDTAPNVLDYVKVIKGVLERGGIWLNVGPLLWNCFENGPGGRREGDRDDDEAAMLRQLNACDCIGATEMSLFDGKVELAWDEVIELIEHMGFEVEENIPKLGSAGYILNQKSMLLPLYQVGFFRAVKRSVD